MFNLYRLMKLVWIGKAAARGPGALVRQRARAIGLKASMRMLTMMFPR